jgi:hypothetical protein
MALDHAIKGSELSIQRLPPIVSKPSCANRLRSRHGRCLGLATPLAARPPYVISCVLSKRRARHSCGENDATSRIQKTVQFCTHRRFLLAVWAGVLRRAECPTRRRGVGICGHLQHLGSRDRRKQSNDQRFPAGQVEMLVMSQTVSFRNWLIAGVSGSSVVDASITNECHVNRC